MSVSFHSDKILKYWFRAVMWIFVLFFLSALWAVKTIHLHYGHPQHDLHCGFHYRDDYQANGSAGTCKVSLFFIRKWYLAQLPLTVCCLDDSHFACLISAALFHRSLEFIWCTYRRGKCVGHCSLWIQRKFVHTATKYHQLPSLSTQISNQPITRQQLVMQ